MARLSTHVLDTSRGKPAEGLAIELRFGGKLVASAITNPDGRTAEPLISRDRLEPGVYELTFHDPEGNYHVPLLLSPYGYSTYRGS